MDNGYNADFLHSTVAGSIGVYDLPDLAASLAPKELLLIGVTDGSGKNNNTVEINKDLSVIKAAYQRGAQDKLHIVPSTEKWQEHFKTWFGNKL